MQQSAGRDSANWAACVVLVPSSLPSSPEQALWLAEPASAVVVSEGHVVQGAYGALRLKPGANDPTAQVAHGPCHAEMPPVPAVHMDTAGEMRGRALRGMKSGRLS